MSVQDFPDWQSPSAIAAANAAALPTPTAGAIASTGVPLLRLTSNLGSGNNQALPANTATQLLATTALNQPGYEGVFTLTMGAGSGTVPFVRLVIVWTDQTTGLTVGQRTFFLTCGNGQALSYYIHGPVKGNQVSITATVLDVSFGATLTWGFNVTSHVYLTDNIIQTAYGSVGPNGYTNPAGLPNAGILLDSTLTPGASATLSRLVAVYSGRATLFINNNGSTALHAYLTDPVTSGSGLYGNANSRYFGWSGSQLPAGSSVFGAVALPYGPLLLQVTNESSTAAGACGVGLIAEDY